MWQEIVIILIGITVIAIVGWKIHRFFSRPKDINQCAGCPGCALMNEKEFLKKGKDNQKEPPALNSK